MNRDPLLSPVAGVFAAQQIKPQARTLAEDRGIRCLVSTTTRCAAPSRRTCGSSEPRRGGSGERGPRPVTPRWPHRGVAPAPECPGTRPRGRLALEPPGRHSLAEPAFAGPSYAGRVTTTATTFSSLDPHCPVSGGRLPRARPRDVERGGGAGRARPRGGGRSSGSQAAPAVSANGRKRWSAGWTGSRGRSPTRTGKPFDDARLELALAVEHLDWAARHAEKTLRRRRVPSGLLMANQAATLAYAPIGVVRRPDRRFGSRGRSPRLMVCPAASGASAAAMKPSTVLLTKLRSRVGLRLPRPRFRPERHCVMMAGITARADCLGPKVLKGRMVTTGKLKERWKASASLSAPILVAE